MPETSSVMVTVAVRGGINWAVRGAAGGVEEVDAESPVAFDLAVVDDRHEEGLER